MMLLTQFVTLGLLTLTTAGGAVGGYLVRARREQEALEGPDYKLIEAEVVDDTADDTASAASENEQEPDAEPDTPQTESDSSSATQSSASG